MFYRYITFIMSNNNIEIEIQVSVENPRPLLEFLEKNGQFISEAQQIDEYFTPAHEDYFAVRPIDEWLRLRQTNQGHSMAYKKWYRDEEGKSRYCDEYETKVGDLEKMRKILSSLDCKSVVIVEKIRKTWTYGDYEIGIDTVKGLGDFVEVEYTGVSDGGDCKKITQGMLDLLKQLGCGKT